MPPTNDGAGRVNRTGLPSNRIGFGDVPVVLVVDLQNALTNDSWDIGKDFTGLIEHTNELVKGAYQHGHHVVFIRNVPYPDGSRIGKWAKLDLDPELADSDSEANRLDARLHITEDATIVEKHQASAFHETELHSMFIHWDVDTVIVCGVSTSGCIRATALGSCARGYRTILPVECVGDRSSEQHEANLEDIDARIGDVVRLVEARNYIVRIAR